MAADSKARAGIAVSNLQERVPKRFKAIIESWLLLVTSGSFLFPRPYSDNMKRITLSALVLYIFPKLTRLEDLYDVVQKAIYSIPPERYSTRLSIKNASVSFYKALIELGLRPESLLLQLQKIKIVRIKDPVKPVIYFEQIALLEMFITNNTRLSDYYKCLDILLIYFLFFTGVRASELVNVKITDLDLVRGVIRIIDGKGGKNRQVPICKVLEPYLKTYVEKIRPDVGSKYLFLQKAGQRLNIDRLQKRIKQILKLGNIEGSCHSFRRGFASYYSSKNVPITFLQKLLGHKEITTTLLYVQVSDQEIFNVMRGI